MMNNKTIAMLSFLSVMSFACNQPTESQQPTSSSSLEALVFAKGKQITNNNFTGTVWLNNLVEADSINHNAVGSVIFEPAARTNWHSHPAGQIILAIEGEGYYQEKGSAKIIVKKGDVVKCPPNIPHWHGASASKQFIQVAITGREKGETVWMETVTDEEYNR